MEQNGNLGGENICQLCAAKGDTCCRTDPDLAHLIFPLSDPESLRLEKYVQPGGSCRALRPNSLEFRHSMRTLFPREKERVDLLFPDGGEHFSLSLRSDGTCVFLGDMGCVLPRTCRPWYCLLFPAWVVRGSLTLFSSENCLIVQRTGLVARALGMMGENADSVRHLFTSLRRDWGFDCTLATKKY